MTHILRTAAKCPTCGATPDGRVAVTDPAVAFQAEIARYDLEALAAEAAGDRAYDESAKVRATQEDIRRLLQKRGKNR